MPHKLLLADDSVTVQRVIELTFADEDVQVIAVGNGADAIERVQRDAPDIVLADIGMPDRDGYDVAAFVKGNPATAHIPVVLLTGAFEPIDESRARAIGCHGVLVKPFEPQMVINRVKDLLAGRAPEGMWSAPPGPQSPVREPHAAAAPHATAGQAPDPLEAYFDQLDAAFAPKGGTPPPGDGFPGIPPAPDAARSEPAHAPSPAPRPAAAPLAAPPPANASAGGTPPAGQPLPVSLVEAFAALLSAEQQTGFAPAAAPSPITDEMIEEISSRVLARMTSEARPLIQDVAEKLVREEIERIKEFGNL